MRPKDLFYGWWVVVGSFWTLFTIVGILYYAFPVFYPHLVEEFQWSRAATTAGYAISTLVIGPAFGICAGILIDRYGSKRVIILGLAAAGAALWAFGSMHSLAQFYAIYFLHTLGYACAGPVPNQVLISNWFKRFRGRAMGLAYLGIGIGGAAAPMLATYLIVTFGWRISFRILGSIVIFVLLPLVFALVKTKPAELGLKPDGDSQGDAVDAGQYQPTKDFMLGQALRTRAFWAIAIGSFLSIASIGAVIQHFVFYMTDLGFTRQRAAGFLTVLLISSIVGRVVMGYLADIFPKKHVMIAAYLCVALAIPLLFAGDWSFSLPLFAVIFGFGMGADYMMIPLVTAQAFGLSSMGKIMGLIFVTDTVGQALFPVLVGHIFDRTGTYQPAFLLVFAAAVVGTVAITFVPRNPVQRDVYASVTA